MTLIELLDSESKNRVSHVGMTNNPWRRAAEHKRDSRKSTKGKSWNMFMVKTDMDKSTARMLENAIICIFTIDALANARHEIALKKLDNFAIEMDRAASLCKMPVAKLRNLMRGDY